MSADIVSDLKEPLRDSLLIEYHHLKACTGAISIQAVVARASASGLNTSEGNPAESLAAFVTSRDARFLQDVLTDSKRVLQIATMSAFRFQLPYAPARVKISVISASVFLLKALSVGSTNTDVRDALHILDQCTARLKASPPDDMDFALRYASLVEKHAAQFRANLMSSRGQAHGDIRMGPHGSSDESSQGLGLGSPGPPMQADHSMSYMDSTGLGMGTTDDAWIALPFDTGIAPFSYACDQLSMGLDVDSLNFLWSLPDMSG